MRPATRHGRRRCAKSSRRAAATTYTPGSRCSQAAQSKARQETAHFKEDFKRTMFDLFRDYYWATPGRWLTNAGVKFVAEPYDGPWKI